ncbi:MAG: hypothetical protein RQ885_12160 [Desulfurococcales archaeon]|nr:hypothetical protein [Desulfurococcales archaeon]
MVLYEGIAQKCFGVSSLDGSTVPLDFTATSKPIEIPRSLWGLKVPQWSQGNYRNPVDQETQHHQKQKNINSNQ